MPNMMQVEESGKRRKWVAITDLQAEVGPEDKVKRGMGEVTLEL